MKSPKLFGKSRHIRHARKARQVLLEGYSEEDESDIYSQGGIQQLLEDDDISPEEAAFMEGYEEDAEE